MLLFIPLRVVILWFSVVGLPHDFLLVFTLFSRTDSVLRCRIPADLVSVDIHQSDTRTQCSEKHLLVGTRSMKLIDRVFIPMTGQTSRNYFCLLAGAQYELVRQRPTSKRRPTCWKRCEQCEWISMLYANFTQLLS